ncbi:(2Fe-2S)-binding protein [Streptomyces subrutilus]|uniref:(2Fe-2S)-binding protein n=1 Tax=Streptomyces subrutilus TaxID=36818 RepID=UPI0034069483
MSGATGDPGDAGSASPEWGWEPVPHGGESDSDATAFVKLPQDMLDALGTGEPLAAPGHGYVPPPMIVPLGSVTTDPSATGTWTLPVQWPEAAGSVPAAPAPGTASGRVSGQGPAPVGGPIPATIPLPASVAAAYAQPGREAEQEPEPEPEPRREAQHAPRQDVRPEYGQQFGPEFGQEYGQGYTAGEGAHPGHGGYEGHDPYAGQEGYPGREEYAGQDGYAGHEPYAGQGAQSGHDPRQGYDAQGGQGFHGGQDVHGGQRDPHGGQDTHPGRDGRSGTGETAEWRFPDPGTDTGTGQWALPDTVHRADGSELPEPSVRSGEFRPAGLGADWSRAPATLPGGAAAPWANHPDFEGARGNAGQQPSGDPAADSGVLPGTDAAVAAAAAAAGQVPAGPGTGALRRGPRVLGGPGVGTPLPEGEPVHSAPHDIEAAHGTAAPGGLDLFGGVRTEAEAAPEPEHPARDADGGGHAFAAFGHAPEQHPRPESGPAAAGAGEAPEPAEGAGDEAFAGATDEASAEAGAVAGQEPATAPEPEPEPEPESEPGRGAESGPESGAGSGAVPTAAPVVASDGVAPEGADPGGAGAAPVPDADTADRAVAPPEEGDPVGLPGAGPAYEEETDTEPVAQNEHPAASYVLRVNGADRPVTGAWIGESLLYVLRERLGLAGAKDGCSQGECGACAVQVDGRLVASCLVPAATAAGSEVRTVEGLATDGELSDVQQALCRSGAVQCGFCVPGMAMTIHDLLEGNHAPSELETRQALCGNLCRCSGYAGVIGAVREVVAERAAAGAEPPAAPAGPVAPASSETGAPGSGAADRGGPDHGASDHGGPDHGASDHGASAARIPHQAPPGEGGFHGAHGAHGHGIHHGGTE